MKQLLKISGFLLFTLLLMMRCENPNQYEFEPELVLNGQLNAGQSIDSIYVSLSADILAKYNFIPEK